MPDCLHEFGDVALMGDGIGLGVVAVGGVELDGLVELNLRAGKIVVVEEARSGEVGVFGSLGLVFCGCARRDILWFSGLANLIRTEGLGEGFDRATAECKRDRASWRLPRLEARGAGCHGLLVRRTRRLLGARDVLNAWALAARQPPPAVANLRHVHDELSQSAAEGVAMHAASSSAALHLVSFVLREKLREDVALLESQNSLRVGDRGALEIRDQAVQFALRGSAKLAVPLWNHRRSFASTGAV